jgi:hypothetical protein
LECGEVTQPHEASASVNGLGDLWVVQCGQDASQSVPTTGDQRYIRLARTRPLDGLNTFDVAPRKALMAAQGAFVDHHGVAQGFQAL